MSSPPVSTGAPSLGDYGRMLVRGWALILAATVLSVGAAWLADSLVEPTYTAASKVLLTAPGPSSPRAAMDGNRSSLVRVESYVGLAASEQVLRRVIVDLDLDVTPAELASNLLVIPTPGSALIDINAASDDAGTARDVANSVALNLIELVEEIDLGADGPVSEVVLIDAASLPSVSGTLSSNLLLGGVMGFVVSAVLVVGSGVRRDTISSRSQIENIARERIGFTGGVAR